MSYLAILAASFFIATGQILLKKALTGVDIADKTPIDLIYAIVVGMFQPKALLAIFLCGVGSLIYFISLRLFEISVIVPAVASMIVAFVALIGWYYMKEAMPPVKIAGLCMIVIGVILVSRPV